MTRDRGQPTKPQRDLRSPEPDPPPPSAPQPPRHPWLSGLPLIVLVGAMLLWSFYSEQSERGTVSYTAFKQELAAGTLRECSLEQTTIICSRKPAAEGREAPPGIRIVRVEDPNLVSELEAAGVEVRGVVPSPLLPLLAWLLPLAIFAGIWLMLLRRSAGMGAAGTSALGFGKSRAKLVATREVGVTFDDVAGCDEAKQELGEVIDFLKAPERFTSLGAKIPQGVLLVGPPGTGKTLLARAVAGEAEVPFFSLSGSDFVEMFVGVGAARVRDLFEQAKQQAPCIVFIDELDAVGRRRGAQLSMSNDERENTLNQLLVELDGFERNAGVILLAATNRPDVLDPALLRPGRFDRQIVLDAPDAIGREAILRVHARGIPLGDDVDLAEIARSTPGFSGADLANAMNEAALLAARRAAEKVTRNDFEEAVEKVVAGPERKSRRLAGEEKRRVAYHEAGHALVALRSDHGLEVRKVSIVPRGRAALGYTLQLPTGDRQIATRSELLDRLRGLLGGRAAEEIVFDEPSTGAENDLQQATALARRLVCQFGMGHATGLMHCATDAEGREAALLLGGQAHSDATARAIDEEVIALLAQLHEDVHKLLSDHRDELDTVASVLLERETLDARDLEQLIGRGDALTDVERGIPPA